MDAPFLQKIEAHRHEDHRNEVRLQGDRNEVDLDEDVRHRDDHEDHRGHERHAPIGCDEEHDDEPERERPQEYRTREIGRDAEPRWQEKTDAEPTSTPAGNRYTYCLVPTRYAAVNPRPSATKR